MIKFDEPEPPVGYKPLYTSRAFRVHVRLKAEFQAWWHRTEGCWYVPEDKISDAMFLIDYGCLPSEYPGEGTAWEGMNRTKKGELSFILPDLGDK